MTLKPPLDQRRRLLLSGAVAATAVAGAGWGWWQSQRSSPPSDTPEGIPQFWEKTFDTPLEGHSLALHTFQHRPLLLNFWATWCPPCVAEMPLLNHFFQQQQANGWQVLGIAVDKPVAVRQFLARQPVDFPVVLAPLEGADLARALGNLGGGLPFTVLLDANGQVRQRKIGQVTPQLLQSWTALR